MKKRLFTFALLLTSFLAAFSQTAITGRVTDSRTGEPLIGATLVLKQNGATGAVTDADGRFTLSVPAALPVTLVVLSLIHI